ncbi:hypothetical protein KC992_03900 [Candidatus Saccharibacteria bacterium]|nr:hypothetical protein [Candidatus Saccharibacteria bacterium]
MIKTIAEAEQFLARFYPKAQTTTGKNVTVERMWPLLEKVGNPQDRLKVVHIAGTSGKTSTTYFVASLLHQAGARVGATVSPHVSSLTERLQLDGHPVSEQEFCNYFNQFIDEIGEDPDASYFEFLITFVLWVFAKERVDYAVIETGLGGLHDGTNVCRRKDKVCIITDIGFDHQHILGNTLSEIAGQKIGIVHPENHIFTYHQKEEISSQFKKHVEKVGAVLHELEQGDSIVTSKLVEFQKRNWQLAYRTYTFIAERDSLVNLTEHQLVASQILVPGRMQTIITDSRIFVLDGAHNTQKMQMFVESFRKKYPGAKVPVLLAVKEGKDYKKKKKILKPVMSQALCAGFERLQDMPHHSVNPELLVAACKNLGVDAVKYGTVERAVSKLIELKEPLNIVTGSFYVLGDVLKLLHA